MQANFSQLTVGFVLNPRPCQAVLKIHLRLGLERAKIVLSTSTHIGTKHSVKGFTNWTTQAKTELHINSRIKGKCQSIINPCLQSKLSQTSLLCLIRYTSILINFFEYMPYIILIAATSHCESGSTQEDSPHWL